MTQQVVRSEVSPQYQAMAPSTQGMALDVAGSVALFGAMREFVKAVLREGIDFGAGFPGSDKPTLLKPGAEKLLRLFSVSVQDEIEERAEDWTGAEHGGEPFFYYLFKFEGRDKNGHLIATAHGSCNSWESKYRYRQGERACPQCGKATIKRSKYPPREHPEEEPGWYCYTKIGGCGANFAADDSKIVSQQVGRVKNPDPADQANTILKQAHKRGYVAVCLLCTCASEYFTQDLEDRDEDGQPPTSSKPTPTTVEGKATTAPVKAQQGTHWITNAKACSTFWAATRKRRLSNKETHEMLGVEHMEQYAGSMDDAINALDAKIAEKVVAHNPPIQPLGAVTKADLSGEETTNGNK